MGKGGMGMGPMLRHRPCWGCWVYTAIAILAFAFIFACMVGAVGSNG